MRTLTWNECPEDPGFCRHGFAVPNECTDCEEAFEEARATPVETCGAYYLEQGGIGVVTVTNTCRLDITHTGPHGQPAPRPRPEPIAGTSVPLPSTPPPSSRRRPEFTDLSSPPPDRKPGT